jgi:putative modified peptide
MSEETVQRFVERLNGDAAFRARVQQDAASAFTEFGLSPVEQAALSGGDEDALRRLANQEVSAYGVSLTIPPIFPWGVQPCCRLN